jgi:hypothetical protein
MASEDDVALNGGEQTPAPVTPASTEPAPHETAKQTVRRACEQAQARAAEKDEARAPRAPSAPTIEEPTEGSDPGKPTLDRTAYPDGIRTRDQQGRFVRGEGQEPAAQARAAGDEAPEPEQPPSDAPLALRPPPGWSAAARAQFANLPPEVREAVAKREADVASGFQALQHYKGLETYTPIIEGSGINHAEFTKRAVEWEQSLKTNPVGTLLHVAKLGNIDIVRVAQMVQQQAAQQGYQPSPPATAREAVHQGYQQVQAQPDIEALINHKLAEREAHESVNDFLADPDNIHAEAVADDMALLITNGRADDLKQAYDMACWAHPEIRALLIREASAKPASVSETDRARRTASEARAAAKATVGAPSGPRPEKKDDRPPNAPVRYDVRRAYQEVLDRQS